MEASEVFRPAILQHCEIDEDNPSIRTARHDREPGPWRQSSAMQGQHAAAAGNYDQMLSSRGCTGQSFNEQETCYPADARQGLQTWAASGKLSPYHVLSTLNGYQTGLVQHLPRNSMSYLQQTFLNQQLHNLEINPLAGAQKAVADKAFCSAWLDSSTVLVGTKCNSLLAVHPHSGSHTLLQYPQQPVQRLGPDLLAASAGISCGQHAVVLSPSGKWLATGGQAPQDILLWQVVREEVGPHIQQQQQDCMQLDRLAGDSSSGSRTALQPVQTLMGHADWVFDLAWLDDSCFVSAGRDRIIKLWQLQADAAAVAAAGERTTYTADAGACHASVRYHKDKVRCIKYEQQQQLVVSMCVDGTLGFWTPELQPCGGCALPREVESPQALLLHGNLVAVGALYGTELIDSRVAKPVASAAVERRSKRQRVERPGESAAAQQQAATQRDRHCRASTERQQQHHHRRHQQQQQQQDSDADDASWDESEAEADNEGQGTHTPPLLDEPLEQMSQDRLLSLLHIALWFDNQQLARRIHGLLPAEVYYAVQRGVETQQRQQQLQESTAAEHAMQAAAVTQQQPGHKRLRAAEGGGGVQADIMCSIAAGQHGVRSLSLHHHLLGTGTGDGQLFFHDMRKLSSHSAAQAVAAHATVSSPNTGSNISSMLASYDLSWVPYSWGQQLPARVGCLGMPALDCRFSQVLGSFGFSDLNSNTVQLAVYTHCWDPTGTQLFLGGGPLQLGYKGCALALYSS